MIVALDDLHPLRLAGPDYPVDEPVLAREPP
jgi:hypothetical protein